MEGKNKMALFVLGAVAATAASFFYSIKIAFAEAPQHIIINEIQTAGSNANNEFVELYNPTDNSIVLDGFKLSKKTKNGTGSALLSNSTTTKFTGAIPSHGYFLIVHPSYNNQISADIVYSSSNYISSDNTLLLYNPSGTLIDKVGFGSATDFENAPALNPPSSQSIERDNFLDTDNNAADFFIVTSPSPQNSSVIETVEGTQEDDDPAQDDSEGNDGEEDTSEKCATASADIKLNEIFPWPDSGDEFVEIKNIGQSCVDVSGWNIMDEAGHKIPFPENSLVEPDDQLTLEGNLYLNNDSDTVYLLPKDETSPDEALDHRSYEKGPKDFSYSFDGENWLWTSKFTPGVENEFDKEETAGSGEADSSSEKVYLSEILPNPKGDEKTREFIEIVNRESESVDLFGFTVRDGSKTGKYLFNDHELIKPGDYFVIYRSRFKIALNNSNESVSLFNPKGKLLSSVSYDSSTENVSYNFDGETWRWSKFLTPTKENKFDSKPLVTITKPKHAFKDLLVQFSVRARDKETKHLKYVWDFGDGHKSYLKDTSHKYLRAKKYHVTLSVRDASQTITRTFPVVVEKYPRPKIELTELTPNPSGRDSDLETLVVKNGSGKKVDLQNYKIATGTLKLVNHPIYDSLVLNPGEEKIITRQISKFSLANKAGKAALVYPDGKIADSLEYAKDKIEDDEVFAKVDGQWQWIAPPEENNDSDKLDDQTVAEPTVLGATDENISPDYLPAQTYFSPEDAFIFLSQINFASSASSEKIYCPLTQPSSLFAYLLASVF